MRQLRVFSLFFIMGSLWASEAPKNIIIMIGDGMGPAHISAYRHFKDDPSTPQIETTIFDQLMIGAVSTDPDEAIGTVTDSAAAATALSSGVKTYNGAINFDRNKKPLIPLFYRAVEQGKSTGVVVTSQVNHATPAAFAAVVRQRHQYDQIASQYLIKKINNKPILDVILGGGLQYFREGKDNLLQKFKQQGYQVSTDVKSFKKLNNQAPLIGLYANKGLQPYLDRKESMITLPNFMDKALARLKNNPKGFVLLVEGSQIDWASHDNDILDTMWEMDEFAQSVQKAVDFAKKNTNTLVLVTADHETGGLSLGTKGEYSFRPQLLTRAKISISQMLQQFSAGTAWKKLFADQGVNTTDDQIEQVSSGLLKSVHYRQFIDAVYDSYTQTGWTTKGHTGVDVWLMGYGKGVDNFKGHWSNEQIGKQLIQLIQPSKIKSTEE